MTEKQKNKRHERTEQENNRIGARIMALILLLILIVVSLFFAPAISVSLATLLLLAMSMVLAAYIWSEWVARQETGRKGKHDGLITERLTTTLGATDDERGFIAEEIDSHYGAKNHE